MQKLTVACDGKIDIFTRCHGTNSPISCFTVLRLTTIAIDETMSNFSNEGRSPMRRSILHGTLSTLVLGVLSLVLVASAQAQMIYEVAGGSGSARYWQTTWLPNPLTDYWWTIRSQYIVRASEMQFYGMTAGKISSLAINLRNSTPAAARQFTIKMRNTTLTTAPLPQSDAGMTTVFSSGGYQWPTAGATDTWVTLNFSEPFDWDGVSNLHIDWCSYRTGYTGNTPWLEMTQPNPLYFVGTYMYQDNINYCVTNVQPYYYTYTRPVFRFGVLSGIETSFPDDIDPRRILRTGVIYDGIDPAFPKPSLTFRQRVGQSIGLTYRIVGPLPARNVIYQGVAPGGNPNITHSATSTGLFTYTMNEATGPAAGVGGALNLTNIQGGSYVLEATYSIPGYTQQWQKEFIIAYPNDLSVRAIRSPLAIPRKYPKGVSIPVSATIQNVGVNDITSANLVATVRRLPDNTIVWTDTVPYTGQLSTGQVATLDFDVFQPAEVSQYSITVCGELLNAFDNQPGNDCQPSTGTYTFQTKYNEEVGANEITSPITRGTYYVNRPFIPKGTLINGGIQDLSNIPVRMQIYQLPARTLVYNQTVVVPDVGAEVPFNLATAEFPTYTPAAVGQYEACMTVEYPGDPVPGNNTTCLQFTVSPAMSGTYTIGTLKTGDPKNYLTFQAAVNDLYLKGVSGPVTFELTDESYSVGDAAQIQPALDLTSKILGVSSTNSITFKPSVARSVSKGSITVTLNSAGGVGVLMGQNVSNSNTNSVQFEFSKNPSWANTDGYITFDGGSQKSIIFQMNSTNSHRAPFYLGDGAHDIAIKNVMIRNAPTATASYATALPSINYAFNQFKYDADIRTGNVTYSAGIVSRQKVPVGRDGNNAERLDTVIGSNNAFTGNEINGFGYGIVSIGIGTLIKGGVNEFRPYYTTGTQISGNTIFNVRAAGIFLGYEDNAQVTANRIYNVGTQATGGTNVDAAGIVAGGVSRYHNINARIDRNEISAVSGDVWARGIVVEQVRNAYPALGVGGTEYFPKLQESTTVANNVVWGVKRSATGANMAGIHVYTQRSTTATGVQKLITPSENNNNYFTRKDMIVNNTIMMQNDNVAGTGAVVGLGIQHANGAVVKNNAVIMQGAANAGAVTHTAMLYEGIQMTDGNDPMALVSDRNAFDVGTAALVRFIEINSNSDLISAGSDDEFRVISQWRSWTKRDNNSVSGSFANDFVFNGVAPNQQLRIKTNPTPIGSLLSNRGERIAAITNDIDGNNRGAAGQPYDLGADEFDGRQYVKDLEAVTVLKPTVYRATTGGNADAEYIMTQAPVAVTGLIRNNGGLPQTNSPIRCRIFIETAASNNAMLATPVWSGAPVIDRVVNANVNNGQEASVAFNINWEPQSYQQLAGLGYMVPATKSAMVNNLTPRYMIEVSVSSDENASNNITSKVVRFFMLRSNKRMIVSLRGGSVNVTDPASTPNQIASRLNGDSLITTIERVGYIVDPINDNISYDVIDRDGFEERAIDYTMYKTVWWSSSDDALSRFERRDLRFFAGAGKANDKKNLALAGQNYPRQHVGLNVINDQSFIQSMLRVTSATPNTPTQTPYSGRRVRGEALARGSVENVVRTGVANDPEPQPALVRTYSDLTTSGVVQRAYVYPLGDRTVAADSVMGTATASLNFNSVYLGVDWRHWQSTGVRTGTERIIRGIVDFFETNGGIAVPVQLTSFDAKARGRNVDVNWTTASEKATDRFEIERSDVLAGSDGAFATVGSLAAAGTSQASRDYLYRDVNVPAGRYLYRLTTIDRDGSRGTTSAVEVEVGGEGMSGIASILPQPASTEAMLSIDMPEATTATVEIVNGLGQIVEVLNSVVFSAGTQTVSLPVSALANGTYTVVISSGDLRISAPMVIRK